MHVNQIYGKLTGNHVVLRKTALKNYFVEKNK